MERMWKADETEKSKNNDQESDSDTGGLDLCYIIFVANNIDDCKLVHVVDRDQYELRCDLQPV